MTVLDRCVEWLEDHPRTNLTIGATALVAALLIHP